MPALHNLKQVAPMAIAEIQGGLTPAEDNPWYLLATLHGASLPAPRREVQNRYAWNRYYACRLTNSDREKLKGRVPDEELTPLTDDELLVWQRLFHERAGSRDIDLPDPDGIIELNNVCFSKSLSFSGFIFFECYFNKSIFYSTVDFIGSSFIRFAHFAGAAFTVGVNFKESIFDGVDFEGLTVSRGGALFNYTTYAGHADFSYIRLPETAQFHRADFNKSADFKGARIGGFCDFREVKIWGWAGFQNAEFGAEVLFTDARFQAPTNFDSCQFEKSPPQLDGATLHQRTNLRRVIWPKLTGLRPEEVENLTDAYSCLKLEMDKQKRHEDELLFFANELACRRRELGRIKGLPISLYWLTSDYGRSYCRPFLWLVMLFNVGAPALFLLQPDLGWEKAVGLSALNCLAGFGLRKELMGKTLESLGTGALIVSGIQMFFGLVFLFLIGLGLRNRFRMK